MTPPLRAGHRELGTPTCHWRGIPDPCTNVEKTPEKAIDTG